MPSTNTSSPESAYLCAESTTTLGLSAWSPEMAADAIAEKKSDKAFSILDALFYQKADPESIISVIGMAYIDFYRVRIAAECGVQLSEVAKDFSYGKREFVLKKTVPKIRNITTDALRKSLDAIVETTGVFHSVTLGKRTELEKLIAKLLVFAGER